MLSSVLIATSYGEIKIVNVRNRFRSRKVINIAWCQSVEPGRFASSDQCYNSLQ